MHVCGVSFIRNGVKFDYPFVEAIKSILPLCDSFVVAVGNSDDTTLEVVKNIAPDKIIIVETVWNDDLREGGFVLADETNKALQAVPKEADWIFYIQGDEVLHEQYIPTIRKGMEVNLNKKEIDGLLFHYLHFYGSYDYLGLSPRWYNKEIRVVKNHRQVYSYHDAQGFRKGENEKLNVCLIDAYMYHYGWVKEPEAMQRKQETVHRYWHDDQWIDKNVIKANEFDYGNIDALKKFSGTHPQIMNERIQRKNWKFEFDMSFNTLSLKDRVKIWLRENIGIELGYKNYKLKSHL